MSLHPTAYVVRFAKTGDSHRQDQRRNARRRHCTGARARERGRTEDARMKRSLALYRC